MKRCPTLLLAGMLLAGCAHVTGWPAGSGPGDDERLFDLGLAEAARGSEPRSLQMLLDEFPQSAWRERSELVLRLSRTLSAAQRDGEEAWTALQLIESRPDETDRERFDQGLTEAARGAEPEALQALVNESAQSAWRERSELVLELMQALRAAEREKGEARTALDRLGGRVDECAQENARLQQDLEELKKLTIEMELRR